MAREPLAELARRIAVAACAVAIVASATSAYAAPTSAINIKNASPTAAFSAELAAKQAEVDALEVKLDDLNNQAEIASEEYNQATEQLALTSAQVDASQNDLNNTRTALAIQEQLLEKRLAAIYRDDSLSAFSILLDSKSVADFITRVKYINTVSLDDHNTASALKAQKGLMESQLAELQRTQARAQELEFELKARRVEVDLRIAEQEKLLDTTQADIRKLLDEQAAQRASASSALAQEVLSGANKLGIAATPGTPVETALGYIGVPYVWGGESPSGLDCSGLVLYVFNQHGVKLPHYSGWQFLRGEKIPLSQIQPNDVVFFGSPVHHVGIYAGGGYFIEAPHRNAYVRITKLAGRSDIAGVRRYQWVPRTEPIKGAKSSIGRALSSVR